MRIFAGKQILKMKYNTEEKRLALPDYGRNIQNMVDHCLTIADREERTRCAHTIISIMGNLFPHLRDVNNFKHILWDHLAIMADFKLDIDYPYDVVKPEELFQRPQRLPYPKHRIRYRHYGNTMERMIDYAKGMAEGPEKERLVHLLATHLKLDYLLWNKDSVDNDKILKDMAELSGWDIVRKPEQMKLLEGRDLLRICNSNAQRNLQQQGKGGAPRKNQQPAAKGGAQRKNQQPAAKGPQSNARKQQKRQPQQQAQ